jgi:virulence factor Mce-like protein
MNRQVPTLGKLLTMVIFALSCFGLTLFLWLQFGGSVPFKPQQYRIETSFPEATQLATEADVRIAGVAVGHVKLVRPGSNGRSQVKLEIGQKFAPLPLGTKAILRQKTVLGETYIALTPPSKATNKVIPEGGVIPDKDVGSTVELDEVFSTFDPATRKYFQEWMQQGGRGLNGQGGNAGKSLVELQLLVSDLSDVSKTLNEQVPQLRTSLRDGTTTLNAATAQRGALQRAITETDRVFKQTGDQEAALTAFVQKLPKFLAATKTGTAKLESFARDTGAAAKDLQPTAKALGPAARSLAHVSPEIKQLLVGVERVNDAAKKGLPATETTLQTLPVILDGLDPFLKQLNPITEYASLYTGELTGAIGNLAAATNTNADIGGGFARYRDNSRARFLRAAATVQPDTLTSASNRFSTTQGNAYRRPGWASLLGQALPDSYSAQSCGTTVQRIPDTDNARLNELQSAKPVQTPPVPDTSLIDAIRYSLFDPTGYFPDAPTSTTPSHTTPTTPLTAPVTCNVQAPFSLSAGKLTTYPQLPAAPSSTEPSVTGN